MFMIKSNGGDGYIKDCTFTNFIGHSNAYALDIDEYWTSRALDPGNGVVLSGLTFSNWQGTIIDPKRASINVVCADGAPCTGISISNINFWTDTKAAMHYFCRSAYGSGYCLKSSSGGPYQTTTTVSSAPANYNGAKMSGDLPTGLGLTVSIAIPAAIPTSFYPGVAALKPLQNGGGAGAGNGNTGGGAASPTTATTPVTTGGGGGGTTGSCSALYGQCGGTGYTGATCCASGKCKFL